MSLSLKLGLRSKIIALSSLLLLLPWFAYQFINEMESFLRLGQQQTLLGTTSAIAMSLHERPRLFNEHANSLPDIKKGRDLYVYDLTNDISIDGDLDDWQSLQTFKNVYSSDPEKSGEPKKNTVSFNQLIGKKSGYLFAHFEVTDPTPLKREQGNNNLTNNDHLIIAMSDPQGNLQRFIISVSNDGWFNAYRYAENSIYAHNLQREKSIQGIWKTTDKGYNIELRFPLTLLGDKLGFQLNTLSPGNHPPQTAQIDNTISTSNILNIRQLGSVLIPSPEIKQLLLTMSHTRARLWVVDKHQRVIAKSGDIHQATGSWPEDMTYQDQKNTSPPTLLWSVWTAINSSVLLPIYDFFLSTPQHDFVDSHVDATQLNDALIAQALTGKPATQWRINKENNISMLSAAHPIFGSSLNNKNSNNPDSTDNLINRTVVGAVIAEETNLGIVAIRNQALQSMFNVLLAAIIVTGLLLFIFTSTIVGRIRKLRDQSEQVIDKNGRICGDFIASNKTDEIGDLSRSMGDMVTRLGQYHHYVEQLSGRLSHELRTPVAVVRSSLENLSLLTKDKEQQKYIDRSQQAVTRLNKILTSMAEASRIEQTVLQAELQVIDLQQLLNSCLQGYEMIYTDTKFKPDLGVEPALVNIDPDFIVQLLDKIVHNATEFSPPAAPICITLTIKETLAQLTISNDGPLLPLEHTRDLFQSMVSMRPASQQHDTHLGLGLYIAKVICDHHKANISIANKSDLTGVVVTITFPLHHV